MIGAGAPVGSEDINLRVEGHNQKINGVFRPRFNWEINKVK